MWSVLALIGKDLRLLWRDRAGLIFLTAAPIVVITVAGFSLANLYGTDPSGQTAYEFPLLDEDGSALARTIRERLANDRAVQLRVVRDRTELEHLVQTKQAGTALVIPKGTEAAVRAGGSATLILYTDPVKYLERLNVQNRLLEVRDALIAEQRTDSSRTASAERERLVGEFEHFQAAAAAVRTQLQTTWAEAQRARVAAIAQTRQRIARVQDEVRARINAQVAARAADATAQVDAQVAALQQELRTYFAQLTEARTAFTVWLADLRRLAGSHAGDIPPPPSFPALPERLRQVLDHGEPLLRLPTPDMHIALPALPEPEFPPLPDPPTIDIPSLALPPAPPLSASLAIEEVNLTGGPVTVNTFDQNVPGFSVTFLLLGMLLGVSLGVLDERDWGTFDRLRAMPIPSTAMLIGKLLSRFVVGMVQMVALFAVGWLAFGISLGPQPWALLLPTAGIVFAGTAFGLVVAAVATSREAVMPVGSIVIVTMAAVGGCWWPIDLEPRWMRTVALAFPTTWAMDAFNDLMIRRRSETAALLPTAVMLAYGTVYLVIGALLFRRRRRRP